MATLKCASVLLFFLLVMNILCENDISKMDSIKILAPTASYSSTMRKEFTRGFSRKALISNVDILFFRTESDDPQKPLQLNTPDIPSTSCFNISNSFECHAPVTYTEFVYRNPDKFLLNISLSAFVRQLICRKLVFDLMIAEGKKKEESRKLFDLHFMCPNPCRDGSRMLCAGRGSISYECFQSRHYIYENSFYCRCDKFMRWSKAFKKCVPDFGKGSTRTALKILGCVEKKTRMLVKIGFGYKCVCKPGFTGINCDEVSRIITVSGVLIYIMQIS